MKEQALFFLGILVFGCLLMLSCDKEQFKEVETDLIQTQQEIENGEELADIPESTEAKSERVLYHNSFETKTDLASVFSLSLTEGKYKSIDTNAHPYVLSDNAPRSGGGQSLIASGGACSPIHYFVTIGPFEKDQNVLLKFWAQDKKADENLGFIRINIVDDGEKYNSAANYDADLMLEINDATWKPYESKEVLHLPAGKFLQVDPVTYGGTGSGSAIYLDLLEVISVIE